MKWLLYTAALLLAVLSATALHWAAGHYRERPAPEPFLDDPRLSFRGNAWLARGALARYRDLPPYEQRALKEAVTASLSDLDGWARGIASRAGLVCVGERHDDAVRAFIAREVLPRLDYDTLMVEAGEDRLSELDTALAAGEPAVLLGARFGDVMRATGREGKPPLLVAVDETAAEIEHRVRAGATARSSREDTLASKVRRAWHADRRHVLLIGALHCRDIPGWLFHRVASEDPRIAGAGMLGTAVLERYHETGAQLLFYLLEEMGLERKVLVIPDVAAFPREIQAWLSPVADALAGYRSVILFDAGPPRD